jgi:RHS repeat-associated protein
MAPPTPVIGQLGSESGPGADSYAYDDGFNLTGRAGVTFTYDTNRLMSAGSRTFTYDAWGSLVASHSNVANDNPFRWNGSVGYRYIAPTGLYHAGAREYDPTVGRWLQRDPIGMSGGHPNLYAYCANNPVEAADPDGLRHFAALGRASNLSDEKSWWDCVVGGTEWLLSLPWKALKWVLGYNQTKLAPGTAGFEAITGDPYRDGTEEGDELADLMTSTETGLVPSDKRPREAPSRS